MGLKRADEFRIGALGHGHAHQIAKSWQSPTRTTRLD